jgi:hypothetical protein
LRRIGENSRGYFEVILDGETYLPGLELLDDFVEKLANALQSERRFALALEHNAQIPSADGFHAVEMLHDDGAVKSHATQ